MSEAQTYGGAYPAPFNVANRPPPFDAEVDNRFRYHPATTDAAKARHEAVRDRCRELAMWLQHELPSCREASLALTTLQETMMWANAAIACHPSPPGP